MIGDREQIADIIAATVSSPSFLSHEPEFSAAHRLDQLAAADAILAALDRPASSQGEVERLREALEPFVRHGRAAGAFGGDPDPIRFYTDTGYREVPVADFERARTALVNPESRHLVARMDALGIAEPVDLIPESRSDNDTAQERG